MTAIQNDLRRNVFGCSTEGPSFKVPSTLKFLGEAEIDQLHISSYVKEKIFWLKISANTSRISEQL